LKLEEKENNEVLMKKVIERRIPGRSSERSRGSRGIRTKSNAKRSNLEKF